MKKLRMPSCAAVLLIAAASTASAMDGTFDRSAEVDRYVNVVATAPRDAVMQDCKEIYVSGISDRRLGDALQERLLRDFSKLAPRRGLEADGTKGSGANKNYVAENVDVQFANWLSLALASMGIPEYLETLKTVARDGPRKKIRQGAASATKQIEWHRKKNELMSDRRFHTEGDNQRVSQLLNLLRSTDMTYKKEAIERFAAEKLRDPRIYRALDEDVRGYLDRMNAGDSKVTQTDRHWASHVANCIKQLGMSDDRAYRSTMEQVLAAKVDRKLHGQASVALNRLQ